MSEHPGVEPLHGERPPGDTSPGERPRTVVQLLEQIARRDRELDALRARVEGVQAQLAEDRRAIAELSGRLTDAESLAARRQAALEEARRQLDEARRDLRRTQSSAAYRAARKASRLVRRVAPPGSRRSRVYRALRRTVPR